MAVEASRRRGRWKHGGYGDQGRKAKIGNPSAIDHQKHSNSNPRHAKRGSHLMPITAELVLKFRALRLRNEQRLAGEGGRG